MEFSQQSASQNSIVSIEDSEVVLSHASLRAPCYVSAKRYKEVSLPSLEFLNKETLFTLLNNQFVDILIIGTGKSTKFLSPKQQVEFSQMGLAVECMNNFSACSSFNLLLNDARSVGLLIL